MELMLSEDNIWKYMDLVLDYFALITYLGAEFLM